jgi:hypothetical protein
MRLAVRRCRIVTLSIRLRCLSRKTHTVSAVVCNRASSRLGIRLCTWGYRAAVGIRLPGQRRKVVCSIDNRVVVNGRLRLREGLYIRGPRNVRCTAWCRQLCIGSQLFPYTGLPRAHFQVRPLGKGLGRQRPGERLAVQGIYNLESFDRLLQEWHVELRLQQQLHSLPSHVSLGRQSRDGRSCERIPVGLERVEAAERLVDERYRVVGRVQEEAIVVPTDQPVESGELRRSDGANLPRRNVLSLRQAQSAHPKPTERTDPLTM